MKVYCVMCAPSGSRYEEYIVAVCSTPEAARKVIESNTVAKQIGDEFSIATWEVDNDDWTPPEWSEESTEER